MKGNINVKVFEERNIYIYTPPNYSKVSSTYPVVYLQDGMDFLLTDKEDIILPLEEKFMEQTIEELIIVGIEPKNRIDEYSPWYSESLSPKFNDFGGKGEEYIKFIVERLKPFIDESFSTNKDAESTGIMGASLGGLISLYATYLFPEVFGKVGCISASFWYKGITEYIEKNNINMDSKKIYMSVGSLEGLGKKNLLELMVPNTKKIYDMLLEKGFNNDKLILNIENGATHGHNVFVKSIPKAIEWLYKKE